MDQQRRENDERRRTRTFGGGVERDGVAGRCPHAPVRRWCSTSALHALARRFSLLTGRFTQEDPIGLAGGLNLYGFANGDPVTFADPFGLMADTNIVYNVKGQELSRSGTDPQNSYYLSTDGSTYTLDYRLQSGTEPYELHSDPHEATATAQSLATSAPEYINRVPIADHSMPGGTLDFKTQLPSRALWNVGGGTYAHKQAVSNMAWGNYMARRGYTLQESLRGARVQGFFGTGGEDPFDQRMITPGWSMYRP